MKFIISLFAICLGVSIVATAQSAILQRADSLFKIYEEEASLAAYNKILENHPENFTALWRTSLLYSRIGFRIDDEDKKVTYFNKATRRAKHALEIKPKNSYANYVMGVAMGRMALISGAKERVAASRAIKKYAELAIKYDSTNAGAWHLLGRWNFEVDNLNFAERLAANLLFGGLPDGASTQKAAAYIERAIKLNPNYILYYHSLAQVYDELGKEKQAVALCRKALKLPSITPTDPIEKEKCRELIDDIL